MKFTARIPEMCIVTELSEPEAHEIMKAVSTFVLGRFGKTEEPECTKDQQEPEAPPDVYYGHDFAEEAPPKRSYTGFLHIKCAHCGKGKTFCANDPISQFTCYECGETTLFNSDLRNGWYKCECGRTATFKTNSTEPEVDVPCVSCGYLNALQFNEKTHKYEPIR